MTNSHKLFLFSLVFSLFFSKNISCMTDCAFVVDDCTDQEVSEKSRHIAKINIEFKEKCVEVFNRNFNDYKEQRISGVSPHIIVSRIISISIYELNIQQAHLLVTTLVDVEEFLYNEIMSKLPKPKLELLGDKDIIFNEYEERCIQLIREFVGIYKGKLTKDKLIKLIEKITSEVAEEEFEGQITKKDIDNVFRRMRFGVDEFMRMNREKINLKEGLGEKLKEGIYATAGVSLLLINIFMIIY